MTWVIDTLNKFGAEGLARRVWNRGTRISGTRLTSSDIDVAMNRDSLTAIFGDTWKRISPKSFMKDHKLHTRDGDFPAPKCMGDNLRAQPIIGLLLYTLDPAFHLYSPEGERIANAVITDITDGGTHVGIETVYGDRCMLPFSMVMERFFTYWKTTDVSTWRKATDVCAWLKGRAERRSEAR